MWIRTQDRKKLLEIKDFKIHNDINGRFNIRGFYRDEEVVLGIYETKERALEVIYDIQFLIVNNEKLYVMPKE